MLSLIEHLVGIDLNVLLRGVELHVTVHPLVPTRVSKHASWVLSSLQSALGVHTSYEVIGVLLHSPSLSPDVSHHAFRVFLYLFTKASVVGGHVAFDFEVVFP